MSEEERRSYKCHHRKLILGQKILLLGIKTHNLSITSLDSGVQSHSKSNTNKFINKPLFFQMKKNQQLKCEFIQNAVMHYAKLVIIFKLLLKIILHFEIVSQYY